MESNDCKNCPHKGICSIDIWLAVHGREVMEASDSVTSEVVAVMRSFLNSVPSNVREELDTLIIALVLYRVLCIGYYKGRTFPAVPEVFLKW